MNPVIPRILTSNRLLLQVCWCPELHRLGLQHGFLFVLLTVFAVLVKWWTESESDQTWYYVGGYLIFAFTCWSSTNGTM
jgi:hypothetical protein